MRHILPLIAAILATAVLASPIVSDETAGVAAITSTTAPGIAPAELA